MGYGFPRVISNEIDMSHYIDTMMKGISCVSGITEKGPVGKATFISSWPQFVRVFGNLIEDSDFPLLCQRALARGAYLWISRVAHYTSIQDARTLTAISATKTAGTVTFSASSPGTWGNDLKVTIAKTTETVAEKQIDYYQISLSDLSGVLASWKNVTFNEEDEMYIKTQLKDERLEISYSPGEISLTVGEHKLSGGTDGLIGLIDADYIGDQSAGTGFYAFDEVDDALQLSAPEVTSPIVVTAGHAYCSNRTDLLYLSAIPMALTPQQAVEYRLGKGDFTHAAFSTNYGTLFFGWLDVYDTIRDKQRFINPIGDILGVFAYSDDVSDTHYAPAGIRRGKIPNSLGVHYNVATKGRLGEGGILTENQINPICVFEDAGTVLWGNETTQRIASALREIHIRRGLIVLRKAIEKVTRIDLFEFNDSQLWRGTFNRLDPFMREMVRKRAFYDYRIACDQDARSITEVTVNTAEGIDRGEFRVQVWVKPTRVAKWILVDMIITKSGISFDETIQEYNAS